MEVTHYSGKRRIYRVLVTRSGYVRFNPGHPYPDSMLPVPPPQIDSIPPLKFYDLAGFADAVGFAAMPPDISANPQACGPETINNFPTVIVAFYLRDRVIQVVDYHGCFWGPEALRDFQENIAEATGVARWTRAASDSTKRPHN